MFGVTTSDDYRPVAWMGRYPLDVTTMLVGLHIACAVLTALMFAAGYSSALSYFLFDSDSLWRGGQIWRLATYAFIHPPLGSALLWLAIEMYMLFVFGREVERFLGRRAYIGLYLALLFLPALVLAGVGFWARTVMAGSGALHFGMFIAFVTIYPRAELFLRVMSKWVALVLAGVGTLSALAGHDWDTLIVLWTSIAVGFFFVELTGAGPELTWWNNLKAYAQPKPRLHIVQKATTRRVVEPEDDVYVSIDPILDKISQSGIGSLTDAERRQLDRARKRLLKKPE
jgi:membrane associated rhomboid family serine protease